jgi:hypothetical protein
LRLLRFFAANLFPLVRLLRYVIFVFFVVNPSLYQRPISYLLSLAETGKLRA